MSHKGNYQLTIIFTAPPELVAEGDRIFESHAAFIAATHHRDGDKALLRYNLSKGPELSHPMDPTSEPTGNTSFVIMEVYASAAGVADHWKQAGENWADFPTAAEWISKCKVTAVHGCPVVHSLW